MTGREETEERGRVLIVSAYALPHVGGVEVVVAQQAESLARRGYHVTVVTSRCGGGPPRESVDGYDIVRLRAWNGLERHGIALPVFTPTALGEIARLVARADIVHVHDAYHATSLVAGVSARVLKRPLFLTQHVALVHHSSRLVELVQEASSATIGRLLWRLSLTTTTYNPIVESFLLAKGVPPAKIRLKYNGVDTTKFRPSRDGAAATRARHGLDPDRPVILFAGRLVPKKGVSELLEAASPSYQIVLAGPGHPPGHLPTGVSFLGPLSRDELADLYRASDLFAFPARGEMLTLAMQEAMASGLPVVATADEAYARYGFDPAGIALVEPEADRLRAVFLELLGDDGRRAHMAKYSRELALERFDWDRNAAELSQDYEAARRRPAAPGRRRA